nr:MAG TPA: hypothetical protein [Caudoviricetes sp.]
MYSSDSEDSLQNYLRRSDSAHRLQEILKTY